MELILICSLFVNVCFAVPELIKYYKELKIYYLEYKNKKDNIYKDE